MKQIPLKGVRQAQRRQLLKHSPSELPPHCRARGYREKSHFQHPSLDNNCFLWGAQASFRVLEEDGDPHGLCLYPTALVAPCLPGIGGFLDEQRGNLSPKGCPCSSWLTHWALSMACATFDVSCCVCHIPKHLWLFPEGAEGRFSPINGKGLTLQTCRKAGER